MLLQGQLRWFVVAQDRKRRHGFSRCARRHGATVGFVRKRNALNEDYGVALRCGAVINSVQREARGSRQCAMQEGCFESEEARAGGSGGVEVG
ncbi:hypothetical protein CEP53_004514 [Fusarium sp. AF-6]|nr:hypothetical protein CEP53_004514 [Fusarium sp. AF-6]